jgi:hypothetical protein
LGEAEEGSEVGVAFWYNIKKGVETIEVEYANGETTLFVENVEIRPDDPFDVSLDLGKNLRTRNKRENTYIDGQDFAKNVASLKSVDINDSTVIKSINQQIKRVNPTSARLRILLNGEHWFTVSMEAHDEFSLMLRVLSTADGD